MALEPGTRIGAYEVVGPLGAGGMGEVYRARDPTLHRDVAIKVLPPEFAGDAARLGRFEREARLLASLNHPNIAAIYGVESMPSLHPGRVGTRALVLELVPGQGLDTRIAGGPLPIAEACAIARQIVDALDAAHERGIVHRDLKPANIRLTPDGVTKVLDFGLAKTVDGDALGHDSTVLGPTQSGVVLGTAPYMSPEQARGIPVDRRTDIWAFGCVLYEMLTGRRAFAGATASDTVAAILERQPDWTALPAAAPAPLRRLLARCLEKDPKRRLRDIADARDDLAAEVSAIAAATGAPTGAAQARRSWLPWAIAAAALGLAAWTATGRMASTPVPEYELSQLTFDSGVTRSPAVSSDGHLLAYTSTRAGRNNLDLWIQQSTGGLPLRLTDDPADESDPDISPDRSQVVFRSERDGGGAYLVPALGGPARLVAQGARGPRFSPDGTRVAYWSGQFRGIGGRSSAFVLALNGGTPQHLLDGFVVAEQPVWAPDGRSLLVLAAKESASNLDLWRVPLEDGEPVNTGLLDRPGWRDAFARDRADVGTWSPSGVLLARGGSLWSVPLNVMTGAPGTAQRLLFGAGTVLEPAGSAADQVVFRQGGGERIIERLPLGETTSRPPAERLYSDGNPYTRRVSTSRDGHVVVFERDGPPVEIWMKDLRTGAQQLVHRTESAGTLNATIAPDGTRLIFGREGAGGAATPGEGYVADVKGGVPRKVCDGCIVWGFLSDSRRAVATLESRDLQLIDVLSGATTTVLSATAGSINRPTFSPDGRWLAFRRQAGDGRQDVSHPRHGRVPGLGRAHRRADHYRPAGRLVAGFARPLPPARH